MAKNKVQCLFKKDAEDIYVIQTLDLGLRTDCFVADAFIKRNDEDGTTWSVSYDYLEHAIQYENAEDAKEAADRITEVSPSEYLEVLSLAQAEESVKLLTSTTRNPKDLPTIVPPKILKGPDVSMEETEVPESDTFDDIAEKKDKEDVVNHPSHYETGKFECIEVMEEIYGREDVKAFCRCNAFKYLYRCKNKNGNQDIDKARWYINKYLDLCEEDGDDPDYPSLLHDVLDAYKKYDEEKTTKEVKE